LDRCSGHSECFQYHWRPRAIHLVMGWGLHLEREDVQAPDCESILLLCCEAVRSETFELVDD
jgi:hypothetical protein